MTCVLYDGTTRLTETHSQYFIYSWYAFWFLSDHFAGQTWTSLPIMRGYNSKLICLTTLNIAHFCYERKRTPSPLEKRTQRPLRWQSAMYIRTVHKSNGCETPQKYVQIHLTTQYTSILCGFHMFSNRLRGYFSNFGRGVFESLEPTEKEKEKKIVFTLSELNTILCELMWKHCIAGQTKKKWNWYNKNSPNTHPFKCMRHIVLLCTKFRLGSEHYTFINLHGFFPRCSHTHTALHLNQFNEYGRRVLFSCLMVTTLTLE